MHSIKDTVKQLIGKSLDAYNTNYTKVVNTRIDNIVAQAGNDNTEIVDARIDSAGVTHTTLNNRILAETKMNDEQLVEYTGSSLSVDDTMPGYLQNIEIKGDTIQNEDNLEDIRSVGDKIEGQELYEIPVLSRGKNLININDIVINEGVSTSTGNFAIDTTRSRTPYIKFNPNVNYVATNVEAVFFYDKNKQFISVDRTLKGISPSNCNYVVVRMLNTTTNWQLEEGTVVTPYEPYQEDKLTILSPVQLEKVGDIADRLIEKDGVWGVEKNIGNYIFDTSLLNLTFSTGSKNIQYYAENILPNALKDIYSVNNINSFCPSINRDNRETCTTVSCWNTTLIAFAMPKDMYPTITDFKNNIPKEIEFRYILAEPQFIPLPHDQQVKLRTFATKTNISFLTEIEGTIKAQVPKSLGATVNTHTEQISNLNKELDRVKKLEESTVSTVETESDFTTVEATSNGYFEDVKLEGKTLVNLANNSNNIPNPNINHNVIHPRILDVRNKNYTLVIKLNASKQLNCKYAYTDGTLGNDFKFCDANVNGVVTKLISPNMLPIDFDKEVNGFRLSVVGGTPLDVTIDYIEFLEGDHTQNPPSGYIEGLKSVGEGTDEIVVSSVNDNLFACINTPAKMGGGDSNSVITNLVKTDTGFSATSSKKSYGIEYAFISKTEGYIYVKTEGNINSYISIWNSSKGTSQPCTTIATNYVKFQCKNGELFQIGIRCRETGVFSVENIYVAYSEIETNKCSLLDKKRLLFYNNETQTWEKPILRQWDSIEKHADGKYYYHQRSGEVVLNGSEFWELIPASNSQDIIGFNGGGLTTSSNVLGVVCDKFPTIRAYGENANFENIFLPISTRVQIRISKSKLSTQDAQGFKQWLQANNVTVVYQLAEEKIYECTNIDLITYANETNYIVESGVIVPRSTLKVHNNISNVVSLLQKKVSLLESNMTKYMITQNRMQLASTYSADSVTFKVDYFSLCGDEENYDEDLYNLILNNILVGKDNYNYDKMFTMILDYASWNQISWEQFDILVGLMDMQHNPPVEDEIVEEIPNEVM